MSETLNLALVNGTHLVILPPPDATSDVIVPGMPIHDVARILSSKEGKQEEDRNKNVEPVLIRLRSNDEDDYDCFVQEAIRFSEVGADCKRAYLRGGYESNNENENEKEGRVTSVHVYRSQHNEVGCSHSCVEICPCSGRFVVGNSMLRCMDIGSVIIADFVGDGLDQILLLPLVNISALTVLRKNEKESFYDNLRDILICCLSKSALVDGKSILTREHNADVKTLHSPRTFSLSTPNIDETTVKSYRKNRSDCSSELLEAKNDRNNTRRIRKSAVANAIVKGLEQRLRSGSHFSQKQHYMQTLKEDIINRMNHTLFEHIHSSESSIINKKSNANTFQPLFKKVFEPIDVSKKPNLGINFECDWIPPLKICKISWFSLEGQGFLEVGVDIYANDLRFSDRDEACEKEVVYQELFLSCSSKSLICEGNVVSHSGCVPILKAKECVRIKMGLTFPQIQCTNADEYVIFDIDAYWKEAKLSDGESTRYSSQVDPSQDVVSLHGMTIGRLRLPIDFILLGGPEEVVTFSDLRPCLSFDYREPLHLKIVSSENSYKYLNNIAEDLTRRSGGNGIISVDESTGVVLIFAKDMETRKLLKYLYLRGLPDHAFVVNNEGSKNDDEKILLKSIENELHVLEKYYGQTELLSVEAWQEIVRSQIRTDEIASFLFRQMLSSNS